MADLPEQVKTTLEVLKREYGSYLEIKFVNKRFSVFEATSKYDPTIGRSRKITRYLGWITEDGVMVPARHRQPKPQEIVKAIAREEAIQKMDLEVLSQVAQEERGAASKYENTILMNLSMNGRISHKTIAQRMGLKQTAAEYQIRKTEQKYNVVYPLEIDVNKLGYLEFVIFIKFLGTKPSREEIASEFEKQPIVQFCAILKGNYDIMLYVLTEKDFGIANSRLNDFRSTTLVKYPGEWDVKLAYTRYGHFPVREKFFDLLDGKVWHRTKESPRPRENDLLYSEYVLLKELASTGNKNFTNIDAKYNFPRGRSQYTYYKLMEKGAIKRVTINMDPPVKSNAIIMMKRIDLYKFDKTRADWRMDVISYNENPTNKYSTILDIWDPDGSIRIAPLYKNQSIDMLIEELKTKTAGAEFDGAIISDVLIGKLCYRLFDNKYSSHYENLIKSGVIKQEPLTQYK